MKHITFALGLFAAAAAFSISTAAQGARSTADGVYTTAQAERGKKFYAENCSFCHGDKLEGSDVIPSLSNAAFLKTYAAKPIAELYTKINSSMPATSPGSMTPAQTADTIAYMLTFYKAPAGMNELPAKPDELKTITFVVTP